MQPYANLDEPREDWRSQFYSLFSPLVTDTTNTLDAAMELNYKWVRCRSGVHSCVWTIDSGLCVWSSGPSSPGAEVQVGQMLERCSQLRMDSYQ